MAFYATPDALEIKKRFRAALVTTNGTLGFLADLGNREVMAIQIGQLVNFDFRLL